MGYRKDREAFIAIMAREGVPLDVVLAVLRDAATLQRLAVAECNGDWPCDDGARKVRPCALCSMGYAPSALSKAGACPGCRAEKRVRERLAPFSVVPVFSGDPRGACVKLKVPSGKTDDWGQTGVCVPTREY